MNVKIATPTTKTTQQIHKQCCNIEITAAKKIYRLLFSYIFRCLFTWSGKIKKNNNIELRKLFSFSSKFVTSVRSMYTHIGKIFSLWLR
jgi:hypothetical protein